ncbi:hypothetical protein ACFGVR_21935 [Mucilaginibacter sp. AW1-3]
MKSMLIRSNRALFFLLSLLLISTNACRKNESFTPVLPSASAATTLQQLSDNDKVHVNEIETWFVAYPQLKPAEQLLNMAQQALIEGKHVVRIPIATNTALYFTKINGLLKVYTYKWNNINTTGDKFTGNIYTYSFQDNILSRLVYNNSQLIKSSALARVLPSVPLGNIHPSSYPPPSLWDRLMCWLKGGTMVEDGIEINGSMTTYWWSCDSLSPDEETNSGSAPDPYDPGFSLIIPGFNPGDGLTVDLGGGSSWVVIPNTNPCGTIHATTGFPAGNLKINSMPLPPPDDGSGGGGCSGNNYVVFPMTDLHSSAIISEPQGYETVTDQITGNVYSYNDIEGIFANNDQLMDQIDASDNSQIMVGPGPIMNLTGLMFSESYLQEIEVVKIAHPDWGRTRVYSVALWNVIGGTTHFILDVAGFVPLIGDAASLINGGIYFIEGDKVNCALSVAAAVPVAGWASIAGKWVKTTVKSVPIADAVGKIAYKVIKVGSETRVIKVAVSIFDYAAVKTLKAIRPADQTLTNISRYLVDQFGMRVAPTETALKTIVDDIVQFGDATGSKTEQLSDVLLQKDGYVKQASQYGSNNGFDGVYIKGDPNNPTDIIINEAKQMSAPGNIKLNPAGSGKASQMSDAWVNQTIDAMRNYTANNSIQAIGDILNLNRNLITKTVTCVDKSTGEIVILKLMGY